MADLASELGYERRDPHGPQAIVGDMVVTAIAEGNPMAPGPP